MEFLYSHSPITEVSFPGLLGFNSQSFSCAAPLINYVKKNSDDRNEMNDDVSRQRLNIIHFISSWQLVIFIPLICNSTQHCYLSLAQCPEHVRNHFPPRRTKTTTVERLQVPFPSHNPSGTTFSEGERGPLNPGELLQSAWHPIDAQRSWGLVHAGPQAIFHQRLSLQW